MTRVVSLLVAAALGWLLLRLPEPDGLRLAALDAYTVLEEPVREAPPDPRPPAPNAAADADQPFTLAHALLLVAAAPGADGRPSLALFGARISSAELATEDLGVHGAARESIVRGLRERAEKLGVDLDLRGARMPVVGGVTLEVTAGERFLAVQAKLPDGTSWSAQRDDWRPARRSSLYPPIAAILLAILFRRPVLALFAGVWTATFLLRRVDGASVAAALGRGLPDVATELFWPKFVNEENARIVGFVVAMLSMVGVMTRSGGIRGLMDQVARLASSVRSTQMATFLMGLAVFFDDYANTILVGSTMRPLTDRMRIAREKLAYIVDATAAPVAGLSVLSTWIAFEVSTFSPQLPAAGLSPSDGYGIFLQTLPYRFYCIFALVLVGLVAATGRDFGPMLRAERRARTLGQLVRPGGKPMVGETATRLAPAEYVEPAAIRAVAPLVVFVSVTLLEILRRGGAWARFQAGDLFTIDGFTGVLYAGSGAAPILVGSTTGLIVALVFSFAAGVRGDALRAAWDVLRAMGVALVILYLAWMIGLACEKLGTAPYLRALLGERIAPEWLPGVLFLLSAAVAFSTGSSWSTMSILLPFVVGLAFDMGQRSDLGGSVLLVISIGAVLEGSIFGDHCSPISDTTVLSSTASASDHIDHVRTQAPYAVLAMLVALLVGYVPCAALGWNPFASLGLGVVVLWLSLRGLGERVEPAARHPRPSAGADPASQETPRAEGEPSS